MVQLIVIDSNVWIFAEIETSEEHAVAAEAVRKIMSSGRFGINAIIVSEVYHHLSRLLGAEDAARRVSNIIEHMSAEWLPYDSKMVKGAIGLAKDSGIRINDALIAKQSMDWNSELLTDNVKDFKKVKGLKIVALK